MPAPQASVVPLVRGKKKKKRLLPFRVACVRDILGVVLYRVLNAPAGRGGGRQHRPQIQAVVENKFQLQLQRISNNLLPNRGLARDSWLELVDFS